MKIFKLSKAEMKKIYSRPGIFIMAFLFILIITASAFVYDVPDRSNGIITISGSTVDEIFSHYNSPVNHDSKNNYDLLLTEINSTVLAYSVPSSAIDDLDAAYSLIDDRYTAYDIAVTLNFTTNEKNVAKHNLKNAIIDFKNLYNQIYIEEYAQILVTEKNHLSLLGFLNTLENMIPDNNDADNTIIINNLNQLDFLNVITAKLIKIKPIIVSSSIIESLNDYYLDEVNSRLTIINSQIVDFATDNSTSEEPEDLAHIIQLISNYKLTIEQYKQIAENSMYLDIFKDYTNEVAQTYVGFEQINYYGMQEKLTRNIYLFEKEDFDYNYANAFNVIMPSNTSVNAFDFAYFTLELFSFVIIVYVVVLGAGMIAGEEANGTLKLLAMRPYKRYKIFLGKMYAAIKVAVIFLVIGGIASLIAGTYLFGANSLPVLSVLNTELIVVMSPYLMFGVYLLTLLAEIIFYIVIAVSISSIFKSYTGAVTISILVYFASMILSFIQGSNFLKYIPLTNTNLFKYFGNSFLTDSPFVGVEALLSPPVLIGTDLIFSVSILAITIFGFLAVALKIFSNRDLK
jgi:ABC-type transport system involved in multi-copper enzyme maturation permease subunit